MDNMPLYLVFLQSLPETLIVIYLGLALIDSKPPFKKVLLIALVVSLLSYVIRYFMPVIGVNAVVQIFLIIILLSYLCKMPIYVALISTILGFLGVSMAEIIFNPLVGIAIGQSLGQVMVNPVLRILYPLPEFSFLTALILWLYKKQLNVKGIIEPYHFTKKKDSENNMPIILLCMTVLLVLIAFYCQFYVAGFTSLSGKYLVFILFIVSIISVILTIALIWKIFYINNQTIIVEMQKANISNLQNMLQIIKAQRHDFINHLQVIYGLLKLGENEQIEGYIRSLNREIQVTGDILQLAMPELSAFLLVQMGLATASDISLKIEQESDLNGLAVPSSELVVVVGNLLKNAMEAVAELASDQRTIKLKIFERSKYYVIQTQNQGWVPRELRNRIFESGFSTKTGIVERGIGLASVKYQVEKYRGIVLASSHPQNGTRFTVCYPKGKRRLGA